MSTSVVEQFADHVDSLKVNGKIKAGQLDVGVWKEYTPAITAVGGDPNLANTQKRTARYMVIGKVLFWRFTYQSSGAGTAGSGAYDIDLPPGIVARQIDDTETVGSAHIENGGAISVGNVILETPLSVNLLIGNDTTTPENWGSARIPLSTGALFVTASATIEIN